MFSTFEWMVAMRYLRARRQEGFISVIAWFSLLGIALGVATLIIVMAVMNGFREELLTRILGLNGHLSVYGTSNTLSDFDDLAGKVRDVPGVVDVSPLIEGQVMATARGVARGAVVRGNRPADLARRAIVADNIQTGALADFKGKDAVVVGLRLAERLGIGVGGKITLISPKGEHHRLRYGAAHARLPGRRHFQGGHVRIRFDLRIHAPRSRPGVLSNAGRRDQPGSDG